MNKIFSWMTGLLVFLSLFLSIPSQGDDAFRPPAVPLITHNPYFSVWSMNDHLTDGWSKHWTGTTQAMCGYARIDGKVYRTMGSYPDSVAAMTQTSLEILPTRSIYTFEEGGVQIELTFLSPLLATDLDLLSRPVSYVIWTVSSKDTQPHEVSLYFDLTGEWAVNTSDQEIAWSRVKIGELDVMRLGTVDQPILKKTGDNRRIDWGYVYLSTDRQAADTVIAPSQTARECFIESGTLPNVDDLSMPCAVSDSWISMNCVLNCGTVSDQPVTRYALVAYDDIYSIEYLERKLRPYWRKKFDNFQNLLATASAEFEEIVNRCKQFDEELMADMEKVGGIEYARIGALGYRQSLAAHGLAMDFDGTPLHFSKECFSNGCIATVDVTYPASPMYMLFNTDLLKGQLIPILEYASSKRWRFPFAPHDLGQYPIANGQVYGGGERTEENQMPVEESGNMLIMIAVLAQIEGNADFAEQYWPVLSQWAEFLKMQGMDPENQLCTDDFAGHLAHNANLSIKAIVALGGYAQLCDLLNYTEEANTYRKLSKEMALQWMTMANDGDHYRLAFDKSGTWSQKYNLIWDDILNLDLFPDEVRRKEMAYYKTVSNTYGLPLDNRSKYTKADWVVWTASLAESRADFDFFIHPIYQFLNETPDRIPFTDWYWTHEPKVRGFQARSVVGGVFAPMLFQSDVWEKWANRNQ